MLDNDFFTQYQKHLVWFANTSFGRWFFQLSHSLPHDKRIIKITPNSYTWLDKVTKQKIYFTSDFRNNPRFSSRINLLFRWLPIYAEKRIETNGKWFIKPVLGLTTSTFYPDANAHDGVVYQSYGSGSGQAWGTIRGLATSNNVIDSPNPDSVAVGYTTDTASPKWREMFRSMFLFDTSSIGDSDTINSATLSLYGASKTKGADIPTTGIIPVASTPASNTNIVTADYDQFGSTAFASEITYTNWSTAGYNDFALNASGLANISKTGVSKFGFRTTADQSNTEPTGDIYYNQTLRMGCYYVAQTGTDNDPKLVVVHTTPATIKTLAALGVG